MNLLDLVVDIDYQQKYTYEQRVDLFNKYGLSTATKFFVPIWGLAQYIEDLCLQIPKKYYREFGHGQQVLNSNLFKQSSEKPEIDRRRIRVRPNGRIDIHTCIPNIEETTLEGKMRRVLSFNGNILYMNNYGHLSMCRIPRNLYELIDQWLIDFGYDRW